MYLLLNNPIVMLLGELSVSERFNAMKQLNTGGSNILTHRWFVALGWFSIVVLLILLAAVRKARLEKEQMLIESRFDEYTDQLNLSKEERSIVEAVCRCAGVKHKESIFNTADVFDKGLWNLMQEIFAVVQSPDERQKLHTIIHSVKEKLGFIKEDSKSDLSNRVGKEKTSRQIPVGTLLTVSLLHESGSWTEAKVIHNGEYEILLEPKDPVSCNSGDVWKIRYLNAGVTWEYEAIAMNNSEKGLELNHSEQLRYVNRRQFQRTYLERPAKIAPFSIFQQHKSGSDMDVEFSPAVIKEISGTVLCIDTDLAVSIRQRVLMMFELNSDRMIQDVGEIRDIREEKGGCTIVVELIGLNTKALDKFMHAINKMASESIIEDENVAVVNGEVSNV